MRGERTRGRMKRGEAGERQRPSTSSAMASVAEVLLASAALVEMPLSTAPKVLPGQVATETLKIERAGRRLFLTDAAEWIADAAATQLPGFAHIIDFYHAGQHLVSAAETLSGKGSSDATRWSHYWHHRLKGAGIRQNLAHVTGRPKS